jgi:hypothetical protein
MLRFELAHSCPHQRLQELGRQLPPVEQFDEALTKLVTSGLDHSLLACEELRRESKGAVVLEVLKHPLVRVLSAHVDRKIPLEYFPRLRVDFRTQRSERLEVRSLHALELGEEIIDA